MAPMIQAELGLSDAAIGALQGPAFIGLYVFGLLLSGHLISRTDPWKVAASCVGCWTLGGLVFALSPNLEGMVLGRLLLGAGQAAFIPAALMALSIESDPVRRSKALSMFTTGSATGRSGALLLGGALLTGLGGAVITGLEPWRMVGLVLVMPNLLLVAALFVARRRARPPQNTAAPGIGQALAAVRLRPVPYLAVAVCGAGCVFLVQAAGAWAPSILHRLYGLTPAEAALVFGAVVLVFAPFGHLSGGWLTGGAAGRRFGPGVIMAVAVLAAGLSAGGLAVAPGRISAAVFLCALTVSGGLSVVVALITLQELTPPALKPSVGALFLVVTSLVGVGGGPWLTGLLSDFIARDGGSLGQALALVIVPVAVLVATTSVLANRSWRSAPA